MKKNDNNQIDQQSILIYLLLLFFLIYFICAILLQIRSHQLPSAGGSVMDIFIGSLLMTISIISILIAIQRLNRIPKLFIWLCISAAAGALAIDEWFEFHEYTDFVKGGWWAFGEDDYIKIALWLCVGVGIYILHTLETLSKEVFVMFLIGFLFQFFYLVVEMGDGEFFTLPLSLNKLRWGEEILELFFVESYLLGLLLFHQKLYSRSKRSPNRSNPT